MIGRRPTTQPVHGAIPDCLPPGRQRPTGRALRVAGLALLLAFQESSAASDAARERPSMFPARWADGGWGPLAQRRGSATGGRWDRSKDAPERESAWVDAAAAQAVPGDAHDARAFVLFHSRTVLVAPTGQASILERRAVRILSSEGRSDAVARVGYRMDGGRVREIQAWLRRPDGSWLQYGRERAIDVALIDDDVYSEARVLVLSAAADADSGSLFAFESVLEQPQPFTQFEWAFQDRLPTARSRFAVVLPAGWRVSSRTFNHAPVDSLVEGPSITWELRDLPGIPDEASAPPIDGLVPRLGVTCLPPQDGGGAGLPLFEGWRDVSRWLAGMNEMPAIPTPDIQERARRLVAGARTRGDSVSAIARFAQSIHYASIQVGLSRGGGFRAHPAEEVLAKFYGDCKDKANLMRAMLRSIAVPSWLVGVYSGDPRYVREAWPSPNQFNHCILAVSAWDGSAGVASVRDPDLGALVLFDPTDPNTPLGELPIAVQGSPALLFSEQGQDLIRVPEAPSEQNLLRRRVHVTLSPEGSIEGEIEEVSFGQSAAYERRLVRELRPERYRELIGRWLWRSIGNVDLGRLVSDDDSTRGRFHLSVGFRAESWGRLAGSGLLILRPAISDRRTLELFAKEDRALPIVLPALELQESVTVRLPDGYTPDELPEPVQMTTPFGSYVAAIEVRGGELICSRRFTVRGALLPAERFPAVRGFYAKVRDAERSPVVLVRQ